MAGACISGIHWTLSLLALCKYSELRQKLLLKNILIPRILEFTVILRSEKIRVLMARIDEVSAEIRSLMDAGRSVEALSRLNTMISSAPSDSELLYLRGNVKRRGGDWGGAINDYLAAAAINPDGPAAEAASILKDILEFRNKDLYNQ